MPLYLGIQADLKLSSVDQATLLVTVFGASYVLPSYPMGILADRWSRKKLLAIGLAINALGFLLLGISPSYPWAIASVVLSGLGGSFYHPSATALVARLYPEARGRALGMVGIGASVGFFCGPLYSGWRALASGSWRTPIIELAVLGLVGAALFAWLAEEEPAAVEEAFPVRKPVGAIKHMFPTATLWVFFFAMAFAFSMRDFAGSAMGTATSLFFQKAHDFTPRGAGVALSGVFIMSAISNPLFGHMSDKGRGKWVTFVLLSAAAMVLLFPRVPIAWSVPVLLAYGFFFMSSYPIVEAALMEAVPDAVRGRVFGIFMTIGGFLGNLAHWAVGDWVNGLGTRAASPAAYIPLFTALSVLIVLSLSALPFLKGLSKREHALNPPTRFGH